MIKSLKEFVAGLKSVKSLYQPIAILESANTKKEKSDASPIVDALKEPEIIDFPLVLTNYYSYTNTTPLLGEIPVFSDLDTRVFGKLYSPNIFPMRTSAPMFVERILSKRNTNVTKELLVKLTDIFKAKGVPVKITSLERPGAKTSKKVKSWHATGQAMDIVPENGDFAALLTLLESDPEVRTAMANIGVGYLDETTDEMLRITGGTGKHIHIGPDNSAIAYFNRV